MILAERALASAAIDISDGFARDLGRLCEASGCGAVVWEEHLPLTEVKKDQLACPSELELGLYGGEDYELIFTVRPSRVSRLPRSIGGVALHLIGEIRSGRGLTLIGPARAAASLDVGGYDHFNKSNVPNLRRPHFTG
jgi:thiamine-monophosphate kinase